MEVFHSKNIHNSSAIANSSKEHVQNILSNQSSVVQANLGLAIPVHVISKSLKRSSNYV